MVIKSGEGVVYLTRPQKYFSSSHHPEGLTFFSPAPRTYVPRPTKMNANSPNIALFSQNTAAQQVPRLIQAEKPKINVKKT